MRKIIPTVFAKNRKEFDERFAKLIGISKELQIDFMDGKFVKSKGVKLGDVGYLKRFKKKKFEAHLMVANPGTWIGRLKKKGFGKVIFHYGAIKDHDKIWDLIRKIKRMEMECWIALNPGVRLEKVSEFLGQVDGVLFMGVVPGREGQKFRLEVLKNIRELRKVDGKTRIQVDGGVNLRTVGKLKRAGVDIVNTGSYVSGAEDPGRALRELKRGFV